MPNKKILFSLFLLLFVFSACSSSTSTEAGSVIDSDGTILENFGQPERTAEIDGVIKSITGNLVTIAIVEKQAGENTTETTTEKDVVAVGLTSTTNIPGGGGGEGGGPGRDSTVSDSDRLEKLLERSTDQETITVPVGIAMTKFSEEGEDREKMEASLGDLKSSSMISVWLNQEIPDRKVAEFVNIR
ncbi:MAG: hypothetical protein PF572_02115 [Patescibacteria group bacterium]|jgi:hypothetical protein|nr:hypothetical protein [Patescibacteria group bacterium]